MEFKPRVPREDVNVSPTHPLREMVTLIVGVTVVVALAVALLAWSVDVLVTWIPPEIEARVFGHLGAKLAGTRPAAHDERVETAQKLLERLAARWADSPYPSFRIEVLESGDLNAGALPGGLIVVTSRLLDEVESENELAFVLGHELGHFRRRHHLRRLGRGAAWGLGLAVLGGSGNTVPSLTNLVGELTSRGFDRDQEREADRFALQLVQAEFGHVGEAADFLERLDSESRLVAYVSTHPASMERIRELHDYAREQGWPRTGPSVPLPASWRDEGGGSGSRQCQEPVESSNSFRRASSRRCRSSWTASYPGWP
jgi:predicted Zn-dependent protease